MAFDPGRVDLAWIHAWLSGRALARGLPQPFPDRGGIRAEIGGDAERRRWVFEGLTPELLSLAREIAEPGLNLRAIADSHIMRRALPPGWLVGPPSFAMTVDRPAVGEVRVPDGYRVELQADGRSLHAFVLDDTGKLGASGHAGVCASALVYDRIVTQPDHRRRGLGRVIMHALAVNCNRPKLPHILVATEGGRGLYESMGWRVLAPYASAAWVGDTSVQN